MERVDGQMPEHPNRELLELAVSPVWLSIETARVDDEEITGEEIAAVREAEESIARGEGIPHEEMRREFGM